MNTRAIAYRPPWRIVTTLLLAIGRGSPLVILAALIFFETRLTNQLRLMRVFCACCIAPAIAVRLVERACGVTVLTVGDALVLEHRRWRIEVPRDAIVDVVPWAIPLPAGGVWLRLRSGRRFGHGLQIADPVAFGEALEPARPGEATRSASPPWSAAFARARSLVPRRWYHPVLKFIVFGLVPSLPVFRLHQWVAYGGTFGEYYSYGLAAYLLAFAIFWATYTIYLVLYAALLRAAAETIAVAATLLAPARAGSVRRAVERVDAGLYYGGVPVFLLWLLLAS